jgi:hypothetical protein
MVGFVETIPFRMSSLKAVFEDNQAMCASGKLDARKLGRYNSARSYVFSLHGGLGPSEHAVYRASSEPCGTLNVSILKLRIPQEHVRLIV